MKDNNLPNGKLIVMEGACDGIGKSTQYNLLCERMKKDGYEITNHHFPSYNTYQGAPVEKYLKGDFGRPSELSPYFVNSLYAIDRAITWNTKLKALYEKGNTILLDRYTTSSLIYQSALIEDTDEKIKFIDYVINYEYNLLGIKKPDKVIFLHAPFDLVMEMKMKRTENEGDLEFMKKVYNSSIFLANYLSWDIVECSENNSIRSIEDIHDDIYKLIKN